jgi:thiamine-monophosphate kinase
MAQNEFAIIQQYFTDVGNPSDNTVLAIGDDAAVVEVPPGFQQVVSIDTLIEGAHFTLDASPEDIAHKALAVNLSDLAAMAATPNWFLMSISLPEVDEQWLQRFATGLKHTAECYSVQLIGGDTCLGNLSISIQIAGLVPSGQYVSRAGASPGDLVLVSGQLGNAGLGLASRQGRVELPEALRMRCLQALNRPQPRLELVDFLRSFASAAIDISDGLQGDLAHILKASHCGATIDRASLPVDPWIKQQDLYHYALAAGDDYEICCTLPPQCRAEIDAWNRQHTDCRLTIIGEITGPGFFLKIDGGQIDLASTGGYRHFD